MDQTGMKTAGDFGALLVTGGTVTGWLPYAAALLAVIWWAIRIYETRTVQRILQRMGLRIPF